MFPERLSKQILQLR